MLDNHRWFLPGGLALLLTAIGALFVHRRKPFHLGLRGIALLAACLAAAPTRAATIKGSARNLTTGKPSVGDEVILLTASQPALELMRTKTGVAGQFIFNVGGIQTPLLLCVVHQGIGHYNPAQPGILPVDVQVYDVAKELNDVSLAWDVPKPMAIPCACKN